MYWYSLINPQLLLTIVADCPHVSKELFTTALDCLYNKPLGSHHDCRCGECHTQSISYIMNRPRLFNSIKWNTDGYTTVTYDRNTYCFRYSNPNSNYNYSFVQAANRGHAFKSRAT